MAWKFPITPRQDGDDESQSPGTSSRSLLGADPVTGATRRIMVGSDGLLRVNIVKDESSAGFDAGVLAIGSTGPINDGVLTSIVTHVAAVDQKISKVSCSGDGPADFTLVHNVTEIDIKRSSTGDLDKEFSFDDPYLISSGDTLTIKVYHHATGKTKTFNATIYGA